MKNEQQRAVALEKAKEFVERINPSRNERGYPQGDSGNRLEQILRVADWLLAGGEEEDAEH